MDFFELKDFMASMHPGKKIDYEFDEKCHRKHELIYTNGVPNPYHHVENHHVKMTIEGQAPIYAPIMPHREVYAWDDMKKMINGKGKPIQ
jgi:hypothetical protein